MKTINIDKDFIKKVHGLNQIVKHIFKKYILIDDNIYCYDGGPNSGDHFIQFKTGSILDRFEVPNTHALVLDSTSVFQVLDKQKKFVEWFMFIDEQFIFVHPETKEETVIGFLIEKEKISIPDLVRVVNKNDFKSNIVIGEQDIFDLTKNALKRYFINDKYKIRMTRSLVPGLKKNQGLRLLIAECEGEESEYFFRTVYVNKADKDTLCFHSYKVILY